MPSRISFIMLLLTGAAAFAQDKVTYQDHVFPIFRANCMSCHNPDKNKAGLNLGSFQSTMSGSSNGKVIEPGDAEFSMMFQLVTHEQEPHMPPKGKLSDKDIATIKAWIAGGALETSGSAPVAPSKPKMDLALASADDEKPTGPPPMPNDLPLEPLTRTKRPGATIALDASPWAPLVALAGQKQILMYNPQTAALLGVLPFNEGIPSVVRFSRTGKLLMAAGGVGGQLGKVVLYDVISGKRVTEFGDETDTILAADIAPDQSFVAVGGPSRVVKIFSTENGAARHRIKKHTEWVTALAYSPDGVLLASGDRNGGLYVWEAYGAQEFYNLTGHKGRITDVAFRRDSNVLASASEDGDVKLWDMNSGKEIKTIKAHGGGVTSVDFTSDGRILSCGRDKSVKLWNAGGEPIRELGKTKDIALHTVFAGADGALAVAGDFAGEVKVVKTEDGAEVGKLSANPPGVNEQLAAAEKKLAELQPATQKAVADAAAAEEAAKKAAEAAAQAKAAAEKLAGELAAAKAEQAKWKAAEFKNTVVAAEQEHAARAAEEAQAKAAIDAANAAIAKAQADVAAAEKSLAEAPARVKAKEDDIAMRKEAHAAAVKATEPLSATVTQRESLVKQADDLHKTLTAVAATTPGSKPLADSVAASKAALDALSAELASARQAAATGADGAKKAEADVAAAEAALAAEKNAIAAAPQQIEQRKQAAAAATSGAQLDKKQTALAAATQATAAAKAKLDKLTSEYDKLRQASGLIPATPTTAPTTAPAAPSAVASP